MAKLINYIIDGPAQINEHSKLWIIFCLAISASFSSYLTSFPVDAFYDRVNYINYAEFAELNFFNLLEKNLLLAIFNEPIWLLLNYVISLVTDIDSVIRIYLFFSSFVTAFILLLKHPKFILVVIAFILFPQFLKNYVVHLRQGLAISLFLIGWFSISRPVKWTFFLIAPLVHSSFFFIVFFIILQKILTRLDVSLIIRFFIYFSGVTLLSIASLWIADYIGARQGSRYLEIESRTSGIGLLFWIMVCGIYSLQGRRFINNNLLTFSILIFYFVSYFTLPVAGRIFESGLIIVLLSSLQLTDFRKVSFYSIFFTYFSLQWVFRINLVYFGWAKL